MKPKMIFHPIILFSIFTLLTNCTDEIIKEVEVEKTYSWNQDSSFFYNYKLQMNSYANDKVLFTIGPNALTKIGDNGDPFYGDGMLHYSLSFDYQIQYKLPIYEQLFAGFINNGLIQIASTKNPILNGSSLWINFNKLDPYFNSFEFPRAYRSNAMVINENLQCLIPFSHYNPEDPLHPYWLLKFMVVDCEIKPDLRYAYVDSLKCEEVAYHLPDIKYEPMVRSLHTFDDYFIVSCNSTYRVGEDLELTKILNTSLLKVFRHKDLLYGLGMDSKLYTSDSDANTWQEYGSVDGQLTMLNYFNIDGEILGTYNSQIFHLMINEDEINIKELDNDGLVGHQITSMSLYNDYIYLTTYSGVFKRSYDELFTYKELEETE